MKRVFAGYALLTIAALALQDRFLALVALLIALATLWWEGNHQKSMRTTYTVVACILLVGAEASRVWFSDIWAQDLSMLAIATLTIAAAS